jgi:hypothetical protein
MKLAASRKPIVGGMPRIEIYAAKFKTFFKVFSSGGYRFADANCRARAEIKNRFDK